MEAYWDIVDRLDMLWCSRCMAVAYGDGVRWDVVIVNDLTDALDCVCPGCITNYDLTRPERAELLAEVDSDLSRMLEIDQRGNDHGSLAA